MNSPIRIVQISDLHLFSSSGQTLLGVDTEISFKAVLKLVKKKCAKFDFVLLTGDLSQDGSAAAYKRVADFISVLDVPVYCIPGNHDNSEVMKAFFPYKTCLIQKQIVLAHWQIILLDSHIPLKVAGALEKDELVFMQDCLKAYPHHRALIVFHHHPISIGSKWLDQLGVQNADAFWEAIRPFPSVHTLFFGHVHQVNEGIKNNIPYYSVPSTCIQFKRLSDPFALENLPPGFRFIELFEDGTLKTEVFRLPEYVGVFEADAKGY